MPLSPIRKYPGRPGELSGLNVSDVNSALDKVCLTGEMLTDLRFARTEDMLPYVKTILLRPDRGVSLEFDLTRSDSLWAGLQEIFNKYLEVSSSFKYLMQFSTVPGSDNGKKSPKAENTWVVEYLVNVENKLRDISTMLSADDARYSEIKTGISDTLNAIEQTLAFIKTYQVSLLYTQVTSSLAEVFDIESSTTLEQFRNIAFLKQETRKLLAAFTEEGAAVIMKMLGSFIEQLDGFPDFVTFDVEPEEHKSPRLAVLRVYPSAAAVIPTLPPVTTVRLSYRRFIQTTAPASNIMIQLRNNVAFNTLDTQWYSFYMEVFQAILMNKNPRFTLRCGTYKILDCNIASSIEMGDTGAPFETFPLDILSKHTALDLDTI